MTRIICIIIIITVTFEYEVSLQNGVIARQNEPDFAINISNNQVLALKLNI